jgi:hypothetical protein
LYKITTDYVPGIYDYDYIEDEDEEDDDIPPTIALSLKRFVEFQTYSLVNKNKAYDYISIGRDEYYIKYFYDDNKTPYENLTKSQRSLIRKTITKEINDIIQISVIIEFYNITNTNNMYKNIKIIIFSIYLICWSYILIVSIPSLSIETFSPIFDIVDNQDPFSGNDIN